ncbi:MAG: DUF1583 domain-containing protein [Isosphaerales bacterium]
MTGIAKLETRLGRIDAALKAGRDLLAAAPGNPENYEFFAQLCFQLGRSEEGLDALRRAVRVNPNDTKITLTLAETLAAQYRTDEAIEMYWRAFDKADNLDGKLGTVSKLTELYLQRNQLDRLLTRLQHQERDARPGAGQPQQRDVAICMAQAYAASGDLGSARAELERLLASNTRDGQLLQQLSKLAEEEGDLESAARYQKQLNELAPSDDGSSRLAQLYSRYGELEEAQAVWSRMASGKSEAHRIFAAIDSLLGQRKPQPVLEITESMIRKDPRDWEALYRQGVALVGLGKPEDAAQRFQALLDLTTADDEKSALSKAWSRDPKLKAASARPSSLVQQAALPLQERIGAVSQIRMASKLDNREIYSSRLGPTPSWSPPDFGQARMAALGWLVSLAQKTSPPKGELVVARFRKASEKTPADLRSLWDWFHLCLLRYDNAAAFEAGKILSRAAPTDPLALWAYLYSVGGRERGLGQRNYVSQRGEQQKDNTPPLEPAELDHVLACYASLRTRRPELAQAQVLQHVSKELKRAKRVEEEERFYRDTVAGATQLAQIAGAFGLAAERGDALGLIQLADRFERLQSGRASQYYYTGTFYFAGPGPSIGQGMSVCAGRKAYADVLRLLDHELAAARRKLERQSPGAARTARSRLAARGNYVPNYQIWVNKTSRYVQIPFPLPNDYLDETAIQLLRTAHELYKLDDLSSDLVSHFRRQAEAAKTPADQVYPRLALSSILWWNDDKDDAIAEFTKVAEGSKAESELRLDLAELLEQQGERTDALALADSVQPLDNATMKRREDLALRLSVLTGDLERARQAAERLFGLRLDTDTQVRLAGQMEQLGQHELAEAVLGRARRRAGNKATSLVGMMLQYQRQGKLDVAVQVASQILRSTTATRQTNPNYSYANDPDASRTAAIGVLARSGRLPQLIERAHEQLKKTPSSIQIHQSLADYYKASGQRDQARAELAKIVALRPDDTGLRLQIAQQLVQEGQAAEAIEHYKVILKKDPASLARNFYQVQNAFQQARKTDEMLDLLEQIDLRQLGQSYMVFNLIGNLFYDDKMRDRAVNLFKKAWEAFPDDRSNMLSYIRHDDVWRLPEMYDYAREMLIPKPATFVPAAQWNAVSQILSYNADGRINSLVSRLLDLAAGLGKLDELAAEIDQARKSIPGWTAGAMVRALIDCRLGRYEQAQAMVRRLLEQTKDEPLSNGIFWVIGAELDDHGPTRELAVTAYEASLSRVSDNDPYFRLNYDNGPAKRLVTIYARDNRLEDARRVLIDFASVNDFASYNNYPAGYIEQMRMSALGSAAAKLHELGFTADAVALYSQSLTLSREIPPDGSNYVGNSEGMLRQYREGLTRALEDLRPEDLASSLTHLVETSDSPGSKITDSKKIADAKKAGAKSKVKERDQLLDLMVMVHPRELDKAAVRSLLADAIAAPAASPTSAGEMKAREQLATSLEAAGKKHPDDLSVAVAEALLAIGSGDSKKIEPALGRLNRLVDKTPLEPLSEGVRANSRQRAEAARQVPLWLVARACWKQNGPVNLPFIAGKLAARAQEAARRQTENQTLMAMLREQGELALARGDRAAAEAAWGRMLEIVVEPPGRKIKKPAAKLAPVPRAKPAAPAAAPRSSTSMTPARERTFVRTISYQVPATAASPSQAGRTPQAAEQTSKAGPDSKGGSPRAKSVSPRARAAAAPRSNLPILTLDRFEQAMQIARLAAEHDLPDLSARAVREALRAGPPVVPANPNETRRVIRSGTIVDDTPIDQASPRVLANLLEWERIWQKQRGPAAGVYEALRDAVLPAGRPSEVFLYAPPLNVNALRRPQSAGLLLAAWAVRAGKVDDLKRAVASRQGQVLSELPASVLSAQLALAANDPQAAVAALKRLAARMKADTSRAASELACHAALPALDRPELAAPALEILDSSIKGFESTGQPEPLGTLLVILARHQFKLGDAAGGRKRLDAYLEAMEKNTIRYGGDYLLYLRKQQLQRVAAELARAGLWTDALAALGRFVDAPAYSGGDPPIDDALVKVLRQLEARPAKEQYETLHAWTMPAKERRVARILTSMAAGDMAPEVFAKSKAGREPKAEAAGSENDQAVVSTATALIDAARRAGALDQLAEEARAAAPVKADQGIENAEVLYLLIELARGQGLQVAPRIEARLAAIVQANEESQARTSAQPGARPVSGRDPRERLNFPWTDFLVARAALANGRPVVQDLGVRLTSALIERAETTGLFNALTRLRIDLAQAKARRAGAPATLVSAEPGLALWHTSGSRYGYSQRTGTMPTLWLAHQGTIAHLAGFDHGFLLFDYPLTGSFEFSLEGYVGHFAESGLTLNGLVIEPLDLNRASSVFPVGQSETLSPPWRLTRLNGYNRLTVQAAPGKVRYLVNGHIFFEDDDPSPTSPWIGLFTRTASHTAWRLVSLSGRPAIPREVRLTHADRLEGWISSFYNETQPPRRTQESTDQWGNVVRISASAISARRGSRPTVKPRSNKPRAPVKLDDYDWVARDGVIHGRLLPGGTPRNNAYAESDGSGTEADQSLLSYFRPLLEGDALTYEFLYEPGQIIVHPAVGRLAFLLEPEGVKVHWMTTGGMNLSGLAADNAALEPGNRRGPTPLPLKPGQWNTLKLRFGGGRVTLELNGQAIYDRAIEPAIGRQFGLFHFKDQTAAQARNIVLKGQWPEALSNEQLSGLTAPDPAAPHSEADRRARHDVIGESFFAAEAGDLLEHAAELSLEKRYERLAGWVLPSPDHPVWRLEGLFTPSFPANRPGDARGSTNASGGNGPGPHRAVRLQTGGSLEAPAIELVEVARSLAKLDELAARVQAIELLPGGDPPAGERGKLSIQGLIEIARGDDAAAAKTLALIKPMFEKLPLDQPEWTRWPELVLAARALDRPVLRAAALSLLGTMGDQVGKKSPGELWHHQVKNLRARAELLAQAEKDGVSGARPFGTDPNDPHWARVTPTRAETRGTGLPIPHWSLRDGHFTHYPGHDFDMMYLNVPVRGDFQLDCELTASPGREIQVCYSGLGVAPKPDLKHIERSRFGSPLGDLTLSPPLEKLGDWYPFRLVVKGGRMTAFVSGRKVHEAPAPAEGDPWLALGCRAIESGGARKLAISGNPRIPEKLNLSSLPELTGWLADEYGDRTTGDNPDWDKRGEEITGRLIEEASLGKQESLLRYHRPMVEDGRIAYEFYYDQGKVMVHPALGRLSFLLEPDGVKIHRLTDGAYERSGLTPENAHEEPENRRGPAPCPFKPQAWNRLVLSVTGDKVALELNGQPIYERSLEPSNQRSFALFHYAGETQARVRNVTYQGNWARSLPASIHPQPK